MRRSVAYSILVLIVCVSGARGDDLNLFQSRHYLIHTDLSKREVLDFGRHMDAIFEQYQKRFAGFTARNAGPMPLYLMRTREDYLKLLSRHGINGRNSGGMFVYTPRFQGLATWTQGRSRSQTYIALQHEGFHQFAWHFIGHRLPVWINEGLAQYFEDAIIIGHRMTTGLANARRIERVRDAVARGRTIDFDELLSMTTEQWSGVLGRDAESAALLYAQSWSMVYFLVHGEAGKYQKPFEKYLQLVSRGQDSGEAFRAAFGNDGLSSLERSWRRFAHQHQPDPINTTAARMEFLGAALGYIHDHSEPMPATLNELKAYLQARQFVLTMQSHGVVTQLEAIDDTLYVYPRPGGATGRFTLLEAARDDLPPRIAALGLYPEPTLIWSRNEHGELVQDIEYR